MNFESTKETNDEKSPITWVNNVELSIMDGFKFGFGFGAGIFVWGLLLLLICIIAVGLVINGFSNIG